MAAEPIQVYIEESTKNEAAELLAEQGLDLSEAVNIFLKQVILKGGLPFDVCCQDYKPEVIEALKEAEAISQNPDSLRFDTFAEALDDMDL